MANEKGKAAYLAVHRVEHHQPQRQVYLGRLWLLAIGFLGQKGVTRDGTGAKGR